MEKIVKQLEKNAKYLMRIANDSHSKSEAEGYSDAVKDLKNLLKTSNQK